MFVPDFCEKIRVIGDEIYYENKPIAAFTVPDSDGTRTRFEADLEAIPEATHNEGYDAGYADGLAEQKDED